ncbi:actin-binding Rho-activating protein [Ornithorhynchus anatinus]|uniref:Actin-binding Rho-activating protein n=1 Tax=Ornithorhynchus anatinus TaxID=9258 RepID=F6PKJ7_ORNAN|nr:actin-binding Rho-activating protein [Ornithorhynchus anatinus]
MAPEEKPTENPAKRAIKKIRTATLVVSLARGWQQWANENSTKQAQEPAGWLPSGEKESSKLPKENPWRKSSLPTNGEPEESGRWAQPETPVANGARQSLDGPPEGTGESLIKRKEVPKTVVHKVYERGRDVSLLSHRYENDETNLDARQQKGDLSNVDKILNDHSSPTRRRKCSNLVVELTKGWKQMEQEERRSEPEETKWRSDSVDTEDSGYSGEGEDRVEQEENHQVTAARIKRPMSTQASRFAEKIHSQAQSKSGPVNSLRGKWQQWSDEHLQSQRLNPFSEEFDYQLAMSTRLHKGDAGYGRPKEGTKTAERAKRAEQHIHREIMDLCFVIRTMARKRRDGKIQVTFGELFDRYVRISDKVVGILMRARKHGLVDFEGEMLWQGRDDDVVITLLE